MLGQTVAQLCLGFFSRLPIVVEPKEVSVSSDTGILRIRQFDSQLGFTDRLIAYRSHVARGRVRRGLFEGGSTGD